MSTATIEKKTPTRVLEVGNQVFYFARTQTNKVPVPATVMGDVNVLGVADLFVMFPNGGSVVRAVHQHDDPKLVENPNLRRNGCWAKTRLDRD